MTFKKLSAAAIAALTTLALAACGAGGDSEASVSEVSEIRDGLEGTDFACSESWDEQGSDRGICGIGDGAAFGVDITDSPEDVAAKNADTYPNGVGSVVGVNWTLECGTSVTGDECGEVANILGGTYNPS